MERSFSTEANDNVCRWILFVDFTAQWPHCRQYPDPKIEISRYPIMSYLDWWFGTFFSQYVILILNRQPFFHGFFMPGASASPVPAGGAPSTPDALGRPADGPGRLAPADGARPGATDGLSEERAKEGGGDMGVGELMELIILVYISLYQFI